MTRFTFPKNIKKVLFDMDGTLVDTEPIGPLVFRDYFKSFGVEVELADWSLFTKIWRREATGYDQNTWMHDYAKMNNLNISKDELLKGFYDDYIKAIEKAKPLPGVDNLLHELIKRDVQLGLVTASNLEQTRAVLANNNWKGVFSVIVTKDDQVQPKPSPEPYLLGKVKLGVINEDVLVFEDARNGVTSAKAAGCFVVGLRTGPTGQDLSMADVVIDNLTKVEFENGGVN